MAENYSHGVVIPYKASLNTRGSGLKNYAIESIIYNWTVIDIVLQNELPML